VLDSVVHSPVRASPPPSRPDLRTNRPELSGSGPSRSIPDATMPKPHWSEAFKICRSADAPASGATYATVEGGRVPSPWSPRPLSPGRYYFSFAAVPSLLHRSSAMAFLTIAKIISQPLCT
jgi:hypothetical protein